MKVLITGGAGFIGSHLIEHIIRKTTFHVVCIDMLSYASAGWSRLKDSDLYYSPRVKCLTWNLEIPFSQGMIDEIEDIDIIIHVAAISHVDYSIKNPVETIRNNIMSTVNLLEYARTLKNLKIFQYFSTDEVFGTCPKGQSYKEHDPHRPTNPYSASKAASEDICLAYHNTYKVPIIITNLMNVFGQRQYSMNFIPKVIKKVLNDEVVDIHTESDGVTSGSRFYIHARNVADAVLFIIEKGQIGEKYNIRGSCEVTNLDLAQKIAAIIGKPLKYNLVAHHDDRPGHDDRYELSGEKLAKEGWNPPVDFEKSLEHTVKWSILHSQWLKE